MIPSGNISDGISLPFCIFVYLWWLHAVVTLFLPFCVFRWIQRSS